MKNLKLMALLLISGASIGQVSLGEVIGTVVDAKNKTVLYDARVFIIDEDKKYIARTDPDGRFRISAVPPGIYRLNIAVGIDTMQVATAVNVPMDGFGNAGIIEYKSGIQVLDAIIFKANDGIKIERGFLPVPRLTYKEIEKSAVKFDLKGLIISMTTDVKIADDGSLVFRGARKGDMIYMIDGIKVTGGEANIPSTAIGRMMVYSGGLPANYGDTLGGMVVIETKSYFDLLRDYKSEQLSKVN